MDVGLREGVLGHECVCIDLGVVFEVVSIVDDCAGGF